MAGGGITGEDRRRRAVPAAQAGMTLIEMLIVLVVIGIAAGAVSLGIGSATRSPTAETEARRFATQLQAAADDAMLGDRMVALTVTPNGYGFSVWGGTGWVPKPGEAFAYHRMPSGMVMTLDKVPPVILGVDGAGEPMNATVRFGSQLWQVRYDGMTAHATPVEAAS